jgi:hypothetical protein
LQLAFPRCDLEDLIVFRYKHRSQVLVTRFIVATVPGNYQDADRFQLSLLAREVERSGARERGAGAGRGSGARERGAGAGRVEEAPGAEWAVDSPSPPRTRDACPGPRRAGRRDPR